MTNAIATRQVPTVAFEHQIQLAKSFAASKLFGIQSADQALALMALCEAEGMHPAIAVRDYHIINGKPALKADAMLARFQAAGGKVRWLSLTDECVKAEFSHEAGGTVVIDWDKARVKQAQLGGNGMHNKFPRQMLRARVISEGVRTVCPGCVSGVYTPEEVADFTPSKPRATVTVEGEAVDTDTGEVYVPADAKPSSLRSGVHNTTASDIADALTKAIANDNAMTADRDAVIAKLTPAVLKGTEAFRAAWKALTKTERASLTDADTAEFKGLCEDADSRNNTTTKEQHQ